MRHWVGRKVAVYRATGIREPLKGTLVDWDEESGCVRIGINVSKYRSIISQ
ncbi:hypothetical protein AB9M62_46620 [Bacillales bacterium AN1005]